MCDMVELSMGDLRIGRIILTYRSLCLSTLLLIDVMLSTNLTGTC